MDQAERVFSSIFKPVHSVASGLVDGTQQPERLYHFTSVEAMRAILTSRTLYASLGTALNDAREFVYGEQLGLSMLREGVAGVDESLSESLCAQLDDPSFAAPFVNTVSLQIYMTSFCASEDSAAQWLHYGHHGEGVALEFISSALPAKSMFGLHPVVYDVARQRELIAELFRAGSDGYQKTLNEMFGGSADWAFVNIAANIIIQGLRLLAISLKAHYFRSEEEWRLVSMRLPEANGVLDVGLHFRTVGNRVIPFVLRSFDTFVPISGVVLGYSCPIGETSDALRLMLDYVVGRDVSVRRSEVPVRR